MTILTDLQKDDEVRMFERLNDADLARQKFLDILLRNVALRDDFDGYVRLVGVGIRQMDGRERSSTEPLDDVVAVLFQ